jgi:hypothetical protein
VRVPYEKVYGPGFEDMFRRIPSLVKLERLIGYRPTAPLEMMIDAVAAEMRPRMGQDAFDPSGPFAAVPVPQLA